MVSVLFLGLDVLSQRQVDTMKDYWYDRVQVSIFLCTAKSDLPNCSAGAVTDPQRKEIRSQLSAMKPLVKSVFPESQQQAYDRLKEQYKDSPSYRDIKPEQMPESFRVQLSDPTKYDVITSSFIGAPGVGDVQDQRRIRLPVVQRAARPVLRGVGAGRVDGALLGAPRGHDHPSDGVQPASGDGHQRVPSGLCLHHPAAVHP